MAAKHGMLHSILGLLPVLLLLTACQSGTFTRSEGTMFEQLSGGQFTLHRDITLAPGHVRVIFQGGIASYGASEYEPRCELEVRDILEQPQIIPAGSYRIGKVVGMHHYVDRHPGSVMLAAAGETFRLADDTSNEWFMYSYRMQLLNEQQVEAPTLSCGGAYNFAFYARYPTLQEMQEALGDHATLTPG